MLSTKVGRVFAPAPSGVTRTEGYAGGMPHEGRFDYSYDGAMRSLEQSMLRLGLASVDVVLVHDVDPWTHGEAAGTRAREALAGAWRALADLRAERVVRAIGIGVNDAAVCEFFAREADLDCVLLAGRYSLLEQPALDRFLPVAAERGIGVMLGGVYNSGILATGAVEGARYNYRPAPPEVLSRVAGIERVCASHGVALAHAEQLDALGLCGDLRGVDGVGVLGVNGLDGRVDHIHHVLHQPHSSAERALGLFVGKGGLVGHPHLFFFGHGMSP